MDSTQPKVLPGLVSLGARTVDDLPAAGVTPIQPKRDLSGVAAYRALDNLPAGVTVDAIKKDAHTLAFNPDLDQLSFLNLMRQYGIDDTPTVDAMLESVRARNAGEAGEHVVMIINKCGDFNKSMPKPDPRFAELVRQGKATAGKILDNVRWLAREIKKATDRYQNMLALVESEEQYHIGQYNQSVEACARDLVISREEDEREDKLVKITAILEALQNEVTARLDKEALSDDDKTRLGNVQILVVARIKNLKPMIQKANIAKKRFASQSNANALTALDQYDFATAGIAAWKLDIAGQLDAQTNMAMNLAYLEGVKYTDAQARATADAFDAQMKSMAEMLTSQLVSLDTIDRLTQSLVSAGQTMTRALQTAQAQSDEAARVITRSKQEIGAAEEAMRRDMSRILGSGAQA